jgi:ElaB/YqjD/DUF883 family membrane-anchored ribosome-binding protein
MIPNAAARRRIGQDLSAVDAPVPGRARIELNKEHAHMTNPTRTDYTGAGGSYAGSHSGHDASAESHPAATGADFSKLKEEVANLKDLVSKSLANVGSEAWKTARDVGETVGYAASGVANAASTQAKSVAWEVELVVRRNPLGALAGALVAGILIGLLGRGRG